MPAQLVQMTDPDGDEGLRDNMTQAEGPVSQGTFVDENGDALGDAIELPHFDTVHLEHPTKDGDMASRRVVVHQAFVAEPHDAAAGLAIVTPSGYVAQVNLADLPVHPAVLPPPARDEIIGSPGARLVFPVIAERFESEDQFMALVHGLRDWIVAKPPFNTNGLGDQLALRALFWPSHPDVGLFGTDDSQCKDRLFYGDRVVAKKLLDPFLGAARASLILINSGVRGDAAARPVIRPGPRSRRLRSSIGRRSGCTRSAMRSALATNIWMRSGRTSIRRSSSPTSRPPRARTRRPGMRGSRSTARSAPSHPDDAPDLPMPGVIGTFQGARYRSDLYRATARCLMRETTSDFCDICQDHIRAVLA